MTRAVREATADDVWAVHETARESWHAAYDDLLGSETVDDVVDEWYAIGDLEFAIEEASNRDDALFLVADASEGEPAGRFERTCRGFAHVVPWPEDDRVAYLARLYVRPDAWGEGIGTALLGRLEADLPDRFERLRLAVLAANDLGVSFYESKGFERVEARPSDLGTDLEEYVYEKGI